MKKIGKGKITEDCDNYWLDKNQVVEVSQYENGDEIDSTGEIYKDGKTWISYKVFDGKFNFDLGEEEVELIESDEES